MRGGATGGAIATALAFMALRPAGVNRLALTVVATIVGQACAECLVADNAPDPQYIILDEVAGAGLTLTLARVSGLGCLAAASTFRLLDRFKIGPIGVVERTWGRCSVMGDDLVAGLLAACVVRAAIGFGELLG